MTFGRVTIYWDTNDFGGAIGSLVISRSNNGELGDYSNVTSLNSDEANIGSWVGSSSDDKFTSWYILQTVSSSGSSGSSEAIRPIEALLTNVDKVKNVARIGANSDINDTEIIKFIEDSDAELFEKYGNPVRRTAFLLDSGIGSTVYDFTGNRDPVHSIQEIRVDGEPVSMTTGSFTIGYNNGFIKINLDFLNLNDGNKVSIDWIPKSFHVLSTYKSAMELIDSTIIIDGEDTINPLSRKLQMRLGSLEDAIRPKGAFRSSEYATYDERDEEMIYQWDFYDS